MGSVTSYLTYPEEQGVIINLGSFNRYNCVSDLPDDRDLIAIDLRSPNGVQVRNFTVMPRDYLPILDDKELGLGALSSICNVIYFNEKRSGIEPVERSRLFAYFNERVKQNKLYDDIEFSVRDCIKNINKNGICPEARCPYNTHKMVERPSDVCFEMARNQKQLVYKRVPSIITDVKAILADNKLVVMSFRVPIDGAGKPFLETYTKYQAPRKVTDQNGARTGSIPGHCVIICGWDDDNRQFVFLNSWGVNWGDGGFGSIQYECLLKPDTDLWVIE